MNVVLEKHQTETEGVVEYYDKADGKLYAVSDINKFGANRFSYGAADPSKLQKVLGKSSETSVTEIASQMINQEIIRFTGSAQ